MIIMVMLASTQLSNTTEITEKKIEYSSFSSCFPAEAPAGATDNHGTDDIYGMSKRTVPGGPNPLHN